MPDICYNCGIELTADIATSEHIPAKNLFVGVPHDQKQNLLTVTACLECNQKFSVIDSEIRDMIGISNESLVDKQELTGKAVRGLMKQKNFLERFHFDTNGQVIGVTFNQKVAIDIHTKNFKGLFFKEYGAIVPDNFEINIIADGSHDREVKVAHMFHDFLRHGNPDWKYSGHPSIFKYLISGFVNDASNNIVKTEDINNCLGVAALLVYHDLVGAVVFCGSNDFIEKCKNKLSSLQQKV